MKAVRLLEYGGQLVFNDVPTPTIARDEILVKIKSTAVNHLILLRPPERQDRYSDRPAWIPGHEFSGVVEQIGSDVAACAPGDAVFGISGMGAYAEYLAVKAAAIARKPSNLSLRRRHQCRWPPKLRGRESSPTVTWKRTNDPDPWWCRRCGRLCSAIGIACRCHRHCHGKRRR